MITSETKYLWHTLGGCVFYPMVAYVLMSSIFEALSSGFIHAGSDVCTFNEMPSCFIGQTFLLTVFVGLFICGATVSWHDLLTGRRTAENAMTNFISIFRSEFLVQRVWFALPTLFVALVAIVVHEWLQ